MRVLSVPKALVRPLEKFRGCFTARQFAHFEAYVLGLILGREGRNVQDIAALYPGGCDQTTLNHFLTQAPWSVETVGARSRELAGRFLARLRPKRVWLSLDDCVTPKPYGHRMQGGGYHYSTSAKHPVWGHDMVAALVSVKRWAFGWAATLYRQRRECPRGEFRSKVQMAEAYIRQFAAPGGASVTVLGDAWYFFHRLVEATRERGFDWIFGCKGNRRLRHAGRVVRASALAKRLPPDQFRRITIHERHFVVASRVVTFPKIGPGQVVFYLEVRGASKRIRRRQLRQVATNRCDWTPRTVLVGYMQRQRIENFFKDTKEHSGFGGLSTAQGRGHPKTLGPGCLRPHALAIAGVPDGSPHHRPDHRACRRPYTGGGHEVGAPSRTLRRSLALPLPSSCVKLPKDCFHVCLVPASLGCCCSDKMTCPFVRRVQRGCHPEQ